MFLFSDIFLQSFILQRSDFFKNFKLNFLKGTISLSISITQNF